MTNKIKSDTKGVIETTIVLIFLGAILDITGNTFFGVNLLPLIVITMVLSLIIDGLQSDKRTLKWIENKSKKMFK